MFKATEVRNVAEYLASVKEKHKESILFLHDFIQKIDPDFKCYFAYNMLGYGKFKYTNSKKQVLDWPVVALASQKNYMSVYVCAVEDGRYLAEKYKDKLGKVSVGKSCIRFKRVEDLDLAELRKVLLKAAKMPGLVGAGVHKKSGI